MIGASLMGASVLAGILIQAFTGRVLTCQFGPAELVSAKPIAVTQVVILDFHWRYVVPLAAGFVIGLVCCAWPARKPPRLSRSSSAA